MASCTRTVLFSTVRVLVARRFCPPATDAALVVLKRSTDLESTLIASQRIFSALFGKLDRDTENIRYISHHCIS